MDIHGKTPVIDFPQILRIISPQCALTVSEIDRQLIRENQTRSTLIGSEGLFESRPTVGYLIEASFQTISCEDRENLNERRSTLRTTSV